MLTYKSPTHKLLRRLPKTIAENELRQDTFETIREACQDFELTNSRREMNFTTKLQSWLHCITNITDSKPQNITIQETFFSLLFQK